MKSPRGPRRPGGVSNDGRARGKVMDLKMTGGIVARSRFRGVGHSWSDRQWAALPPERRPEGVVRIGLRWFEMSPEGRPEAGPSTGEDGVPGASAASRRDGAM